MTSDQVLAEIREANLSYLMLAQTLIRGDREQALFRLGLGEDLGGLLEGALVSQHLEELRAEGVVLSGWGGGLSPQQVASQ